MTVVEFEGNKTYIRIFDCVRGLGVGAPCIVQVPSSVGLRETVRPGGDVETSGSCVISCGP